MKAVIAVLLVACICLVAAGKPKDQNIFKPGVNKFLRCFAKCRSGEKFSIQKCAEACKTKIDKKERMIDAETKKQEKVMKLMADHFLPRDIALQIIEKKIPFKGFRPQPVAKPLSADDFVDGDHYAVRPEKLWAQYRAELFNFFRAGNPKAMPNLQMLAHPYSIDDDTLPLFLNFEPTWSTSYERTNDRISDNYDDFMMNVKVNDPTWSPELDRLAQLLDTATQSMENAIYDCLSKYQMVPDSAYKPTFEYYKKTRCYLVDQTTAAQKKAFFLYEQERKKTSGSGSLIYDAKTNYFNAQGNFNWVTFGKISTFRDAAKEGRVNAFQITIQHTSSTSVETKLTSSFGFDLSATISNVSLGVSGQFEKSKATLKTTQQEFHVKLGAVGYVAMAVLPGTWYDGRILTAYKDGPFVKQPSKPYWGPNGSLRLIPKTVFLVVGPKVEMWVCKDDKETIETMKNSSIKANVGYMDVFGLKFDFKKGATMKSETADNKLYKIEIVGNAYDPQIMAIDYESPNYN